MLDWIRGLAPWVYPGLVGLLLVVCVLLGYSRMQYKHENALLGIKVTALEQQRARDRAMYSAGTQAVIEGNRAHAEARAIIRELGSKDASIDDWLRTPIPDGVRDALR